MSSQVCAGSAASGICVGIWLTGLSKEQWDRDGNNSEMEVSVLLVWERVSLCPWCHILMQNPA